MNKVFYPFLFAVFPILFLFAYNIAEVPAIDILLPLLITLAGTSIIFFLLKFLTKSSIKAGLITSLLLLFFFSDGRISKALPYTEVVKLVLIVKILWGAVALAGVLLTLRSKKTFFASTKYLNVAAITLIVISLVGITTYEIRTTNLIDDKMDEKLERMADPPDIYYIILDAYAREDSLVEHFNYDNSEFLSCLENRGFYIASESCSPYGTTFLSIPSSLNMNYITEEEKRDEALRLEMMGDSKVSRLLKDVEYQYIYVGGHFSIKGVGKYADVYCYKEAFWVRVSPFIHSLLGTTFLSQFATIFSSHGTDSILYAFDTLADIPNIKEPTFVYAHIGCPHTPWLFDANGPKKRGMFEPEFGPKEVCQEGYIGNLTFMNKRVEELIDDILSKSDIPPIIIIQGDHGIGFNKKGEVVYPLEILNAYYLPQGGNCLLYESISPVNTFRIIFNHYFGTDYELLEDKIP